jgi:hypothetical protein
MKKPTQETGYAIWLQDGRCIVGFSYPPKNEHGEIPAPEGSETSFAPECHAILGTERHCVWRRKESADYVASCIQGAKVELCIIDEFCGPIF